MGTPFASMGLGAFPSVKDTEDTKAYLVAIGDFWLTECPIARATTWFIGQDDAGDSSGGGGAGTEADPYLCNTAAALDTLMSTLMAGGDVRIRLRGGDVFAGSGTGLLLDVDDVTLDSYGTGKAVISAFHLTVPSGGFIWSQSGAKYVYDNLVSVGYLRLKADPYNPFVEAGSVAEVEATNRSFWWESPDTLYVNIDGSTDPDDFEWEISHRIQDTGIEISADGVRVDNVKAEGWGCIAGGTDAQNYGIRVTASGTDVVCVSNCEDYYSGRHCCSQYNTGAAGGLVLFVGCRAGYAIHTLAAGGATIFNCYSGSGSQEAIWKDCEARFGVLPSVAKGSEEGGGEESELASFFGHTGTGNAALWVILDCSCVAETDKSHATWGEGSASFVHTQLPTATEATPTAFRAIIFGLISTHGQPIDGRFELGPNVARINCHSTGQLSGVSSFLNGSSRDLAGYGINCIWNYTSLSNTQFRLHSSLVGHTGTMDHCYLGIDAPSGSSGVWRLLSASATVRDLKLRNCIFSARGGKRFRPTNTNDAAHFINCAWVAADTDETGAEGCDQDANELVLAADVVPVALLVGSPLLETGAALAISHDFTGKVRVTDDIGPYTLGNLLGRGRVRIPGIIGLGL